VQGAGRLYNSGHRVVFPQAGSSVLSANASLGAIPLWLNFYASHGNLITPAKWTEIQNNNDQGGRAVYLSSTVQQSTLNTFNHFIYETINEEVCRLYRQNNVLDFSKVFLGGVSMGSLATCSALMRGNEFLPSPLGGYYGWIGVVPSLFTQPDTIWTGSNSNVPEATQAQKNFLQQTYASFMWGGADAYFPDKINALSYRPLIGAF